LSYEVREGIVKHETTIALIDLNQFDPSEMPTLEASLVDLADSIAYNCHDLDDGLASGVIGWDDLENVSVWKRIRLQVAEQSPDFNRKMLRHTIIRQLIDLQVTDLVLHTFENITASNIKTLDNARKAGSKLVVFSPDLQNELAALKEFLTTRMYRHPRMLKMADYAGQVIRSLFSRYCHNPNLLPAGYKDRLSVETVEVIVADFIVCHERI
jgi:dGTPase